MLDLIGWMPGAYSTGLCLDPRIPLMFNTLAVPTRLKIESGNGRCSREGSSTVYVKMVVLWVPGSCPGPVVFSV